VEMNEVELESSVLGKSFTLLNALADHSDGVGLTWIAHSCGIPKTTTHRLLGQLEALGVVVRSEGRYRVGSRIFRIGQAWEPYPHLLTAVRRPLNELAATTRTSAVLTVRCQNDDLIAAASLARAEDLLLLRPGGIVPRGMEFVTMPVLAPSGLNIGAVGVAVPGRAGPETLGDAVRHAARVVSASLGLQGASS
jgi:IclR family transcriptional regulator, acetate operon repressor